MGNGRMKENENVYFRARKKAAISNGKLHSRNGAAELLGVSASTLADYELGITKVVPVDKVVLMANLYNCPEFKNGYCKNECPIGKTMPIATKVNSIEGVVLRLIQKMNNDDMGKLLSRFIKLASDGSLTEDKMAELKELLVKIDEIAIVISEVRLVVEKALKGKV